MMGNILEDYFNEDVSTIVDLGKLYGLNAREFVDHVILLLQKEIKGVTIGSENTDMLAGQTKLQILSEALARLSSHASRSDNPHEETAESIGTIHKDEIEAFDFTGIPSGAFPIDVVGYDTTTWETTDLSALLTVGTNTISLTRPLHYILYGRPYSINPQTLSFPSGTNPELYLYIELNKGLPGLTLSKDKLSDLKHRIYLTKLNTATKFLTPIEPIIRMSGRRISENPIGDAIPATGGAYHYADQLTGGWIPGSNREEDVGIAWGDLSVTSSGSAVIESTYNGLRIITTDMYSDMEFTIIKGGEIKDIVVVQTGVGGPPVMYEPVGSWGNQETFEVMSDVLGMSLFTVTATVGNKDFEVKFYVRVAEPFDFGIAQSTTLPYLGRALGVPINSIARFTPQVGVRYEMKFIHSEKVSISMTGLSNTFPAPYSITSGFTDNPLIVFNYTYKHSATITIRAVDISGRSITLDPRVIAADVDTLPVIDLFMRARHHVPTGPVGNFYNNVPKAPWYQTTKNEPATSHNYKSWTAEFLQLPVSHFCSVRMKSCITSRHHKLTMSQGSSDNQIDINPIWVGTDPGGVPAVHYFICEATVESSVGRKVHEEFYIRIVRR